MTLEDQVISVEIANRLKKLGVEQGGVAHQYSWVYRRNVNVDAKAWFLYRNDDIEKGTVWDSKKSKFVQISDLIEKQCFAFTVAELGEMMLQSKIFPSVDFQKV